MAQDLTPWVEHLSGLIFLADPAWHRPSGKQADMAYTFRRLGRAYQAAAWGTVTIPSTNSHIGGKELKAFVSADFLKNSSLS
jgi:hypothetical protein